MRTSLSNDKGLVGVDTFEVDWTFTPNQQMILSHMSGAGALSTITSCSWTFNQAPSLIMTLRDPNNLVAPINPSRGYYYELLYPVQSSTTVGNVAPGASAQITSAVVQLTSIPRSTFVRLRQGHQRPETDGVGIFQEAGGRRPPGPVCQ